MRYLLYNPLAMGKKMDKFIIKLVKWYDKKKENITPISVLEVENINSILSRICKNDIIELIGGDGTLHHLIQNELFYNAPCKIFMRRAGSGNDFARGHKGKIFDITNEIRNVPSFEVNNEKINFINGVGIGIDAAVCDEVNKNNKKESYYITALRVFKNFKPFELELEIDGITKKFENVYFFVCQNGKYMGGGMKIAPKAKRDDDHLDLYVITAKNYKQLIRMFPLVFLGLHTILKHHVYFFKCRYVVARPKGFDLLQTDGEVIKSANNIEIKRFS